VRKQKKKKSSSENLFFKPLIQLLLTSDEEKSNFVIHSEKNVKEKAKTEEKVSYGSFK